MKAVSFLIETNHKLALLNSLAYALNLRTLLIRAIYSAHTSKIHFKSHCLSRNALLKKANIDCTPSHERKTTSYSGGENRMRRRCLTDVFRPKDRLILASAYFNLRGKAIGITQCGITYCCFKNKYQLWVAKKTEKTTIFYSGEKRHEQSKVLLCAVQAGNVFPFNAVGSKILLRSNIVGNH